MMRSPTKKKAAKEEIEEAKKWSTWEKEVSVFNAVTVKETFYVLEGNVTVTWDGEELSFGKGDLVTFPKGLKCKWHVKKKIRKYYKFE